MPLRDYQLAAVEAAQRELQEHRSTLTVMATGTGKTQVFCELLNRRVTTGRALVIAHRQELIDQACNRMREFELIPHVEMAWQKAPKFAAYHGRDVVVASVQTLRGRRLSQWDPNAFSTIIVDEAHHARAVTWKHILDHFRGAKIAGYTATPDRGDRRGLGHVFETVAFQYPMVKAIEEGWLCDVVTERVVCDDFDMSAVRSIAGDLSDADLERAMGVDAVLHQIARPLSEKLMGRKCIVFVPGVTMAHRLAFVLSGYLSSDRVGVVDGAMDRDTRRNELDSFGSPEGKQVMVSVGVLTEGYDNPACAVIAVCRPTKSRALYEQMVGRGTRLYPGKENVTVLDFVGVSSKHELVTPVDILGGIHGPEVVARAKFLVNRVEGISALEALRHAAEQLAKEKAARMERERRKAAVQVDVSYRTYEVNAFGEQLASEKQVAWLKRNGITFDHAPTLKEARRQAVLITKGVRFTAPSEAQRKVIDRYGLRPSLSKYECSQAIDGLAKAGWRMTPDVWEKWGAR